MGYKTIGAVLLASNAASSPHSAALRPSLLSKFGLGQHRLVLAGPTVNIVYTDPPSEEQSLISAIQPSGLAYVSGYDHLCMAAHVHAAQL